MQPLLITIFTVLSIASFWLFFRGRYKFAPLWLMLSAWFIAIAISQLYLSDLETPWPFKYWYLIGISLISFILGVWLSDKFWQKYPWWEKISFWTRNTLSVKRLRLVIYTLAGLSVISLVLFYKKAGNFPIFSADPDAFRFTADEQVPGLINYCAQLARVFIPLSFFLIFYELFSWKKHWDLVLLSILGAVSLILFTSRTQIFFIDLWIMAMYLFMRKPNWKQALKFYPIFLLVSVLVLAAVPIYRQYRSYGEGYLSSVTHVTVASQNPVAKALLPIYIGVSFNQQALLHAEAYYQTHPLQYGKVSLDPFTNLFGKVIKPLNKLKSHFDLGEIFYSWWNTGTYLFPFVQDFGDAAFYFVPFVIAVILTMLWHYWRSSANFLSINFYSYAMFFVVMTVYLSFTVRAEMYIDLFLLLVIYWFISRKVYES
ncbi:MAG TPA: O-antigen polymerase [Methylomirabilota bacterium]|jgi:oligosaccharide repeat unit polymerase|nr:O-antigen polymerase [Methylomirabilota bacterium]